MGDKCRHSPELRGKVARYKSSLQQVRAQLSRSFWIDVESSKVIDLEKFAPRGDLDPVYFDSSYYLYPDGPIAVEALRVIGAAMAEGGVVGLGRLTLSRRERMVVVEPRGTGMALFTRRERHRGRR